jgi:amino acid adenylation domain-containing protein
MSLVGLFETLKNKEIKLNLDERGNIRVIGRRDRLDPALLSEMKEKKEVIVEWLKEERLMLRPQIRPRPRQTNELPPSFAQQRLWFIDQLGGGSPQYNIPGALRIKGNFNEDIAERVLGRIIERHEPLRTVFRDGEDGPLQHIRETFDFQLQRIDLSSLTSAEREQRVRDAASADAAKPFELGTDLMLRAAFLRLSEDEGVLLFNMHHIASDGWSMNVLVREFNVLYEAFSKGKPDPLPPLEVQYADYAQWQREWLAGEVLERQLRYWEQQLAELPQVHGLPLDRPRPAVQTFNGALHTRTLDRSTLDALKRLALEEQATLFMVLQAVFALLLSRHSNSDDIVIGTPVANRLQQELTPLVGFFVNTLVLRTGCRAGRSFRSHLADVKRMNLNAQANQDVPFEYLVERLKPQRSTSHAALFQIMFSMNTNEAEAGVARLQELELTPFESERLAVKFDLVLDVLEEADELRLSFAYNTDLFDESTIVRLAQHFENLARGVAANADEQIERLPLLSERERRHLLYELNETAANYPRELCLHELFEAQVRLRPEAVALVVGDSELRYRELNERANQLAHYLRAQGVGPDTLVGLCVERAPAMVVGILGILKAGGAYVPFDASYPQEQLAYLIKDSAPALVLTQASLESRLPKSGNVGKLRLDADRELFSAYPTHNLLPKEVGLSSKDLAYVIYTSGSTGRPKGVMVEHSSVVNLAQNLVQHVGIETDKAWAWVASYAFDASVKGLAQLMTGRPLLIVGEEEKHDPRALLALLERHRPGVIDCTPSLLELWLSMGLQGNLPDLVIGGEAITPVLWKQLVQWQQQYGRRALNVYGPTECCVDTTGTLIAGETPHIGRPWWNIRCYVLDATRNLAPQGSVGELYIGGEGLARGYLNQPQLTAERLVNVRLDDDAPARLYKTGDLVRYLADGNLEFIGRTDDQVKVRGFRIELGEIQHQLEQLPEVKTAVVIAREDEPGDKKLVAYVTLEENKHNPEAERNGEFTANLRHALQERLPAYMLPSAFVVLDRLPLTSSGKVDRKALPAPGDSSLAGKFVAPVTETEIALAQIWGRLLKLDANSISATANFFELGGHSLLSIRLVAQIRAQWNVELQIRDIFETAQLSALAMAIERSSGQVVRPRIVPQARQTNELATSFAQQRLWFIDKLGGGSPQYNMPGALRIQGTFSEDIAERALRRIIERHEPLRTVFRNGANGPLQHIRKTFDFHLTRVDLSGLPSEEQEQKVMEAANADAAKPFDLSADLMLRASFLRLSDEEGVLLFNMHHIASDGWSMGILVKEFSELYEAFSQGKPDPLRPLMVQYADFAQWQRDWLEGEVLERQLAYWERQLADLPQVHGLPLDRTRPSMQTFNGAIHTFEMDGVTLAGLKQIARSEQATLFMVLQALFTLLLSRHSNSHDIVIGTPVANRLQQELEPLVGFFVNTLVLRADCSWGQRFRDYLRHIKRINLDAQANQDVPFEYLVERLKPHRSTSHAPLFQIMFNMNTNEQWAGELKDLKLTPLRSDSVAVKFDLMLDVLEEAEGLRLVFAYNTDLFDEWSIVRLGEHLQNLARGVVADPDEKLEGLPLLTDGERDQLLYKRNETAADYPERCLQELFEAQVELRPEAVAVAHAGSQLSYQELNEQANQLAHYLRAQGVGPDTLVALCVERSPAMMVSMLGILKAGGAYVPLDPDYPAKRLAYMIEDSEPAVVLTEASVAYRLPQTNARILRLDADREVLAAYPTHNPRPEEVRLTTQHLAYIIYTSGSTGVPKGVAITHGSAATFIHWASEVFDEQALSGVLAATSICFDLSVFEIFGTLSRGGKILLVENVLQLASLPAAVALEVTLVNTVPSAMAELLRVGALPKSVAVVNLAGEALSPELVAELYATTQVQHVYNLYGPSEDTTYSTYTRVRAGERVTIGRPIAKTRAYVLDERGQIVPMGVIGELYLGGAGLARGYWRRPELTAAKFIPDHLSGEQGARLYRTGDLVRYLAHGELEFLGRVDHQVKLRGFRIELGEIEAALQMHTAVGQAAVTSREDAPGDKRLVAYVSRGRNGYKEIGDTELSTTLRHHLRLLLPDYMVPARFMIMDQLPLMPNGKVDRKSLPAPQDSAPLGEYIAPTTPTEAALQAIWQTVLSIPSLSVTTNFFEAGGHSLLAVQLISKTNEQFGPLLQIRDIFEKQTIREMAAQLDSYKSSTATSKVETQSNLLQVKGSKAEVKPLFLVHPVGGYAHCYYELARNLDYQGAVFGLQVDDTLAAKIESMAERYIGVIKELQPNGSYLLGGWSMGGVVAYEMARQLRKANDGIDLLLMIDSFCPNSVPEFAAPMSAAEEIGLLRTLAAELGITDQGLSSVERDALGEMSLEELMALFIRLGREQHLLPAEFDLRKRYATVLKNSRAVHAYRALPSEVEIQLIRAQQNRNPDWTLGWGSVAKKVTVRELRGDHYSLVRQPDVFEVGKVFSKLLSTRGAERQLAHTL